MTTNLILCVMTGLLLLSTLFLEGNAALIRNSGHERQRSRGDIPVGVEDDLTKSKPGCIERKSPCEVKGRRACCDGRTCFEFLADRSDHILPPVCVRTVAYYIKFRTGNVTGADTEYKPKVRLHGPEYVTAWLSLDHLCLQSGSEAEDVVHNFDVEELVSLELGLNSLGLESKEWFVESVIVDFIAEQFSKYYTFQVDDWIGSATPTRLLPAEKLVEYNVQFWTNTSQGSKKTCRPLIQLFGSRYTSTMTISIGANFDLEPGSTGYTFYTHDVGELLAVEMRLGSFVIDGENCFVDYVKIEYLSQGTKKSYVYGVCEIVGKDIPKRVTNPVTE